MKFYPLQFKPILKDRIWGGTKLQSVLNKEIISQTTGESWELSTVPNDVSVVCNGDLKGKDLNELIELYPVEILGKSVLERFGKQFPLLFKFIDAREDLSIQLHPNDDLAQKRHNSFGKTEMWYVMQADKGSRLVVGFKMDSNKDEYLAKLASKELISLLDETEVNKGDIFFLETGTIHAIGGGVVIAEIQQTSDVTYRIYDWDRVDANGNGRELHTDLALDAINFNTTKAKVDYENKINHSNKTVHCDYFKTNVIPLDGKMNWKAHNGSFTVLMCTEGEFSLEVENTSYSYKMGDTVLLPATIEKAIISGNANLLEVWV